MAIEDEIKRFLDVRTPVSRKDFWISFLLLNFFCSVFVLMFVPSHFIGGTFFLNIFYYSFLNLIMPHFLLFDQINRLYYSVLIAMFISWFLFWVLARRRIVSLNMERWTSLLIFVPILGGVFLVIIGLRKKALNVNKFFQFNDVSLADGFSILSYSEVQKPDGNMQASEGKGYNISQLTSKVRSIGKNKSSFVVLIVCFFCIFTLKEEIYGGFRDLFNLGPNSEDIKFAIQETLDQNISIEKMDRCVNSSTSVGTSRLYTSRNEDVFLCYVEFAINLSGSGSLNFKPKLNRSLITFAKRNDDDWVVVNIE